jgi:hypothetical protein
MRRLALCAKDVCVITADDVRRAAADTFVGEVDG